MGNLRVGSFYPPFLGLIKKIYCGAELCWPQGESKKVLLRQLYINRNGDYELTDPLEHILYFMNVSERLIDNESRYSEKYENTDVMSIISHVSTSSIDLVDPTNSWINNSSVEFLAPFDTEGVSMGNKAMFFNNGLEPDKAVFFIYETGEAFVNLWTTGGDLLDCVHLDPTSMFNLSKASGHLELAYEDNIWATIDATQYSPSVVFIDVSTIKPDGTISFDRRYLIQNNGYECKYVGDAGAANGYLPNEKRLILDVSYFYYSYEGDLATLSIPYTSTWDGYLNNTNYFLNYSDPVSLAHTTYGKLPRGCLVFSENPGFVDNIRTFTNQNYIKFKDDTYFGDYSIKTKKVVYLYDDPFGLTASLWSTKGVLLDSVVLDTQELYDNYISQGIDRVNYKYNNVIWLTLSFTKVSDEGYSVSAKVIQANNSYKGPIINNMTPTRWDLYYPNNIIGVFPDEPTTNTPKIHVKQTYKSLNGTIVSTELLECEVPYEGVDEVEKIYLDDRRYLVKAGGPAAPTTVVSHPDYEGKSDENIWKIKNIKYTINGYAISPTIDTSLEKTGSVDINPSLFDDMLIDPDKSIEIEFIYEEYIPLMGHYIVTDANGARMVYLSIEELFLYDEEDPYYKEYTLANGHICSTSLYSEKKDNGDYYLHELIYDEDIVKCSGDFQRIYENQMWQNIYRSHDYKWGYDISAVHPVTGSWGTFPSYNAIGRTVDNPYIDTFIGKDGLTYTITAYDNSSESTNFASFYTEGGDYSSPDLKLIITNDDGVVYDRGVASHGMPHNYSPTTEGYIVMNETTHKMFIYRDANDTNPVALDYLMNNKAVYGERNPYDEYERAYMSHIWALGHDNLNVGDEIDWDNWRGVDAFEYNGNTYYVVLYREPGSVVNNISQALRYRIVKYHTESRLTQYGNYYNVKIFDELIFDEAIPDLTKDTIYVMNGDIIKNINIKVLDKKGVTIMSVNTADCRNRDVTESIFVTNCGNVTLNVTGEINGCYVDLRFFDSMGDLSGDNIVVNNEWHSYDDGDVVLQLPSSNGGHLIVHYDSLLPAWALDHDYYHYDEPVLFEANIKYLVNKIKSTYSREYTLDASYGECHESIKFKMFDDEYIYFNGRNVGDYYIESTGRYDYPYRFKVNGPAIFLSMFGENARPYYTNANDATCKVNFIDDSYGHAANLGIGRIAWTANEGNWYRFTYGGVEYKSHLTESGSYFIITLESDENSDFYYEQKVSKYDTDFHYHFIPINAPMKITLHGIPISYYGDRYGDYTYNIKLPYKQDKIEIPGPLYEDSLWIEKAEGDKYHLYLDDGKKFDVYLSSKELAGEHHYYYDPYNKIFNIRCLGGLNIGSTSYDTEYPTYVKVIDFDAFMKNKEANVEHTYPIIIGTAGTIGKIVCSHNNKVISYTCYDSDNNIVAQDKVSGNALNRYYDIIIPSSKVPPLGYLVFSYRNSDFTGAVFSHTTYDIIVNNEPGVVIRELGQIPFMGNYYAFDYSHDGNGNITVTIYTSPTNDNFTTVKDVITYNVNNPDKYIEIDEYEPISNNTVSYKHVTPTKAYLFTGTFDDVYYGSTIMRIDGIYYEYAGDRDHGVIRANSPTYSLSGKPEIQFAGYANGSYVFDKTVTPDDGNVIVGTYDSTLNPPLFIDGVIA